MKKPQIERIDYISENLKIYKTFISKGRRLVDVSTKPILLSDKLNEIIDAINKLSTDKMVDKNNPLWKWKKADNRFKRWYKKKYGLEGEEIGIMTDRAYKILEKLLLKGK